VDGVDVELLRRLEADGRATLSELASEVHLSRPSVAERIRRLRDAGVIEGFAAIVPPRAVGRPVLVFIQVGGLRESCQAFERGVADDVAVLECHRITGAVSYLIKAAVSDMAALEVLVNRLIEHGQVNTSVVLSSPVERRSVTSGALR
jgi:Lrp/AsnC family leucine-responsive transcriptional regulator